MNDRFPAADLDRLRAAEDIEIETSAAHGASTHRAIIWVVVDTQDRVLIRSYRGPGARWFREISERPEAVVHLSGRSLPVRAVPATDGDRAAACSAELRRKYAGHSAMPFMTRTYLETTLELVPR